MPYLYFDVETCPLDKEGYLAKTEEERKKLINPLDSRIVAIGVKTGDEKAKIIRLGSEEKMLAEFWNEVLKFRETYRNGKLVGFNVKDFDLPVLVTRSFINNVKIVPFSIKEVVDLREKLSAFKFGNVRGKLKEFGELIGVELYEGADGSKVAELCFAEEWKKIEEYLAKDIEITEAIHKRAVALRISEIERW